MIFSESQNILLPNLVWWCSIMSQSVMQFFCLLLLSSSSRSQQGFIRSKYDSFRYIFWTVNSLATKLGLMIHYHKPEWPVKKNELLHSGSRSQWRVKMLMLVHMMSSKPPNILFPNLVLWCVIMSQSVTESKKDLFAIFKVKVSARGHLTKVWQFLVYLLNFWYLLPNLVRKHIIISQSGLWRNWIVVFKVKVTAKHQWMFVQMVFSESLNLLVLLPNLVWWCIVMIQIVFQKDWFVVLKVSVTVKDDIIRIWQFL